MGTMPTETVESSLAETVKEEHLRTWRAFLRAHSLMLRRISRDLDAEGLPPLSWYDVLASLGDAEKDRLRQVELAERSLISVSGLSRLVDRLQASGLVVRVACPEDRRSMWVELTAEGTAMLERMWPVYARGIAEDFMPALGANPCEVRETLEAIGSECRAAREAADETAALPRP